MNKELEALERQKENAKIYADEYSGVHGTHDELMKEIDDDFKLIEQALTPPTEDEVCKALSEYYKKDIQYEDGCFYYQYMITKPIQYITIRRTLAFSERIVYHIEMQLPPYLITLIGRFYEGESK